MDVKPPECTICRDNSAVHLEHQIRGGVEVLAWRCSGCGRTWKARNGASSGTAPVNDPTKPARN